MGDGDEQAGRWERVDIEQPGGARQRGGGAVDMRGHVGGGDDDDLRSGHRDDRRKKQPRINVFLSSIAVVMAPLYLFSAHLHRRDRPSHPGLEPRYKSPTGGFCGRFEDGLGFSPRFSSRRARWLQQGVGSGMHSSILSTQTRTNSLHCKTANLVQNSLHRESRPRLQRRYPNIEHRLRFRPSFPCGVRQKNWASASQYDPGAASRELSIDDIIHNIRSKYPNPKNGTAVKVVGRSRWLGMDSVWEQTASSDGSVHVRIESPDITVAWGYDATTKSVWELDFNGISCELALDEREVRLLMLLGQNGQWASPEVLPDLEVSVLEGVTMPETWRFWHHPSPSSTQVPVPPVFDSGNTIHNGPNAKTTTVKLSLKNGTIQALATYDRQTWNLVALSLPSSGVLKHIRYENWFSVGDDGFQYAREVQDADEGGMTNVFTAAKSAVVNAVDPKLYKCPETKLLPDDTIYDESLPKKVTAYRSRSNHILVQPIVNGIKRNVTMMLDTGASGLCISREFAEEMGMPGFGEVVIAGATQVITSQFRRAKSLQIGPVTFNNPVFMELSLRGIVRAAPYPVVGILGYDIYRRMVLELPVVSNVPANQPEFQIIVHNPENNPYSEPGSTRMSRSKNYFGIGAKRVEEGGEDCSTADYSKDLEEEGRMITPDPTDSAIEESDHSNDSRFNIDRKTDNEAVVTNEKGAMPAGVPIAAATSTVSRQDMDWTEVVMQGRTPLARAEVSFEDGTEIPMNFMLDTGAGGMNIIFHERAKEQLGLLKHSNVTRSSSITGISSDDGTTGSLGVASITLSSVNLSQASFKNLSAYVPERGGLDISMHMAGILCNDLLIQCRAIYDYPRNRVLFIKEKR